MKITNKALQDLAFYTPPTCRGQIVEISYAVEPYEYPGTVFRLEFDHSDKTSVYSWAELGSGFFEPWNGVVFVDGEWTVIGEQRGGDFTELVRVQEE